MALNNYFKNLHLNIRFYILAFSLVLSLLILSVLRLTIVSDQLFYIRLQQIFGLAAILFLYIAVILTPVSKIAKDKAWLPVLLYSRRAIGVSAAYFSLLHTIIAVADQVGGISNIILLPQRFIVAFALGSGALLILLLMAATSFDKAIKAMTFKRWKTLHKFVYLAGVLIIIHVWLIGTHSDSSAWRITGAVGLAVLFGLEAIRIADLFIGRNTVSKLRRTVVSLLIFLAMFGSLALLPLMGGNYHSDHHDEAGGNHSISIESAH